VPENGQLPRHVDSGNEGVRPVAEDGEEKGGGQSMAKERRQADSQRRKSLDRNKRRLGLGQSLDKRSGGGERRGEPVTQPPDLGLRPENRPIKVDLGIGDGGSVPVRAPGDELRLRDRETDS